MIARACWVMAIVVAANCEMAGAAGHRGDPVPSSFAELWRISGAGRGTPVLAGRSAYYLTRERELVALDLPSGVVRWRRPAGRSGAVAGSGAHLSVAGDVVLAGVEDVVAFGRRDGQVVWRSGDVHGDALGVYAGDIAGPFILCGSAAGRIVAIEWRSGRVAWEREVAGDGRSTVFAPRADALGAVAAFTTFGPSSIGGLVAFDPATGRIEWRRTFPVQSAIGSGWAGGPVLAGRLAIVADASGRILAIDRTTGEEAWTIARPVRSADARAPLVQEFRGLAANQTTIFASALDGSVAAYRLADQSRVWEYADGRNGSAGFGLTIDGRRVWCPFIGGLVAIDQRTGRELWRAPGGAAGNPHPPLVSRPYLLAAGAGGLLAFRVGDRS